MIASVKGDTDVVDLLLQFGAEVGLEDDVSNRITQCSFAGLKPSKYLHMWKPTCHVLPMDVSPELGSVVKLTRICLCSIQDGKTALTWAATTGHTAVVALLLEHEVDLGHRVKRLSISMSMSIVTLVTNVLYGLL